MSSKRQAGNITPRSPATSTAGTRREGPGSKGSKRGSKQQDHRQGRGWSVFVALLVLVICLQTALLCKLDSASLHKVLRYLPASSRSRTTGQIYCFRPLVRNIKASIPAGTDTLPPVADKAALRLSAIENLLGRLTEILVYSDFVARDISILAYCQPKVSFVLMSRFSATDIPVWVRQGGLPKRVQMARCSAARGAKGILGY